MFKVLKLEMYLITKENSLLLSRKQDSSPKPWPGG